MDDDRVQIGGRGAPAGQIGGREARAGQIGRREALAGQAPDGLRPQTANMRFGIMTVRGSAR